MSNEMGISLPEAPGNPNARAAPSPEWDDWKWQFANRLTDSTHLVQIPWLTPQERVRISRVIRHHPYAVTPYFLSLVRPEDPEDPVRRQALPSIEEIGGNGKHHPDPLGEQENTVATGLVRRYPDRALLLLTNRCAVYCRHCTRRRLWQKGPWNLDSESLEHALAYLRVHKGIRDVLLSGGDPLILADSWLDEVLSRIRGIRHIEIIRIGSRVPVVLPQRITAELCRILERHGPLWLNTQFNHPREITPQSASACERLLRAGVPVNNQTVLLRGVNDDAETMKSLCQGLLRIRVRPYYLHQCDPVAGAEHFRTPLQKGIEILGEMQGRVSGLAIPRFMVDLPGRGGKVPVQPDYLVSLDEQRAVLRTHSGDIVEYENPPGDS